MIDFVNSIKSLIKSEKTHIDNNVFKLHYKFTVIILIIFSILLTSKQYFGEPIDCVSDVKEKTLVNTYCWVHGTYLLTSTLDRNVLTGLGQPPIDREEIYQSYRSLSTSDAFITQKYYQWVCIVFCFQAMMFYVPRYLWKTWEAGRMRLLIQDLGGPLVQSNWNAENKQRLVNYLVSRKYAHNCYALRFTFCEVLNLCNVAGQIYLTDWMLSGNFWSYGPAVATYNADTKINPMTKVFPKFAKCMYLRYGSSGTIEYADALCLLPLNIVNEKFFVFLWFWFFALASLSIYQLFYRACTLASSTFREKLLRARCRYLSQKTSDIIIDHFSYGDMFFLDLLAKNLNPFIYKELIIELANALNEKSPGFNADVTIPV